MDRMISSSTRRRFLRTLAVGAGGCALGSLVIDRQDVMGQSIDGYLEKAPLAARWGIAADTMIYYQISYYKFLLEKEGREKFEERIKKGAFAAGANYKGVAERLGYTGSDAKAAAAMVPAMASCIYGPAQKYETVNASNESANVKCISCAFWNNLRVRKISEDICSTLSQNFWDGFAQAVNPKLTAKLVKSRPFGDPVCEWVVQLKA